jgi:cytochrome c oxidase cbb3-type subunit 3
METIRKGRTATMPAFQDFLGDDKAHVLAAYVWGLSNTTSQPAPAAPAIAEK